MTAARSAEARRVAVEEAELDAGLLASSPGPRPVLTFDFSGRRALASKGPASSEESSTLKESIIRWLEEQL